MPFPIGQKIATFAGALEKKVSDTIGHSGLVAALKERFTKQDTPLPEATKTIDVPGMGPRTYHFPTDFKGVDAVSALGLVKADDAAKWLPPGLEPVRLPGGEAAVMFTVQDFKNPPDGMKRYQESQFAVLCKTEDGVRGFHVLSMPVNSSENLARGKQLFGLPKEMATVDFDEHGGDVSENGQHMFSVDVDGLVPAKLPIHTTDVQMFQGKLVKVRSQGEGEAHLGKATVDIGEAMQKRYPGLPSHISLAAGVQMKDAEIKLALPEPL
jgi:hypothetical protein